MVIIQQVNITHVRPNRTDNKNGHKSIAFHSEVDIPLKQFKNNLVEQECLIPEV